MQERINNGDQMATIEVSRMNATLEAVERRTYDLEQSKTMALMTGPQIDMNQKIILYYWLKFIQPLLLLFSF